VLALIIHFGVALDNMSPPLIGQAHRNIDV
jgi:hypothetical protein